MAGSAGVLALDAVIVIGGGRLPGGIGTTAVGENVAMAFVGAVGLDAVMALGGGTPGGVKAKTVGENGGRAGRCTPLPATTMASSDAAG